MRHRRIGLTFSAGIARSEGVRLALGLSALEWRPAFSADWLRDRDDRVLIGWGNRLSGVRARQAARRLHIPCLGLEDGFLRSVGLGTSGRLGYALVIDDHSIYFDARRQSRLERLLNGLPVEPLPIPTAGEQPPSLADPALLARARSCMAAVVESRLSKYNDAPDLSLPPTTRPRVLVVDQCRGDCSVAGALANGQRFRQMLQAARAEHPQAEILIKLHPVTRARRESGHFGAADGDHRTRIIADAANPIGLLQQVERVYVVSSLIGFEALLAGVPVTCFGVPFYAGWGLTDDRLSPPRPRRMRRLEELFAAAYLIYSRYLDPDTGVPCALERVIEHLALQRRMFAVNSGRWVGYRIPLWKRWHLRRFLRSPSNEIRFVWGLRAAARALQSGDAGILVWGANPPAPLVREARRGGNQIWHLEDGFLRSRRLGSDLSAPASWVFDRRGIYFDPRQPSDLETILAQGSFSASELDRARSLRKALVAAGVSKYNVGRRTSPDISAAAGRPVILVPGQVPADASVRLGCGTDATNAGLLERVRQARPDAYILYKPHPDLTRGNRLGDARPVDPAHYDLLLVGVALVPCLEVADEVHTMTSLVGFEALLRGCCVHTYGQPFYAGWGLTVDHAPLPRRRRPLSLNELVTGVLLRYPRYINPDTGEFTTPEQVVALLARNADRLGGAGIGSMLLRPLRLLRALVQALLREACRASLGSAGSGTMR
jgi:capsular polysaccharide export protein